MHACKHVSRVWVHVDIHRAIHVALSMSSVRALALAPIAPAEELALECSTKDARKSKTIVDYRLSTILNSKM